MTESSSHCPDCGAVLPDESPQQLCPSCLLKQAFVSRTLEGENSPTLAPPPSAEEIADKFPQFEITECLGRGGMGVVYKARQKSLNRWVAIKILAPERVGDEKFADRFSREARTLAQLNHPNIVTVHDYGETDGLYYIVMEFIDGVNLRDLLQDGKIEATQALTIVPPICEALQYAHDKGIVHRDIKPENLLIDRDGRIKIADFGIASLVGASSEVSGTPPYMAPEQRSQGNVDHRADIYALGAVLYEMLTGERPASPLDVPSQRVQVDVRIDDIVLRALSKEPERRYRSANEFQTVVETVSGQSSSPPPLSDGSPSPAPPPAPSAVPEKKSLFRRWWWVFLVSGLLAPVLAPAAVILFAYLAPREYEAKTLILVQPANLQVHHQDFNLITFAEGLTSSANYTIVSQDLDLARRWMLSENETLDRLDRMTSVRERRGTDLLEIAVRSKDRQLAPEIANAIAATYAARAEPKDLRVAVIERASFMNTDRREPNLRLGLILSVPLGLLLSPLIAWGIAALLHRIFPQHKASKEAIQQQENRNRVFGRLSLGLILLGILGTLAMLSFSRQDELVLTFGAVAVSLGLIFGLFTRWKKVILILLVTGAFLGLIAFLATFLIYRNLAASEQQKALQQIQKDRLSETVAMEAAQRKREADASSRLGFQPEHEMTIPYPRSGSSTSFLDLDRRELIRATGNIHTLATNRFHSSRSNPAEDDPQIEEWASNHGADLMFIQIKPKVLTALFGGPMAHQATLDYDTATPKQVREAAAGLPQTVDKEEASPQVTLFDTKPSEPIVFRTREGGIGILELRKSPDFPKGGLVIRYKTLPQSP